MAVDHILTLSCPDRPGIVHAVTGLLASKNLNVADLQQYSDPEARRFFMRTHFKDAPGEESRLSTEDIRTSFSSLASQQQWQYTVDPVSKKPRVMMLVSKIGHCLNHLLFQQSTGNLPIEIPLVVSNHPDYRALADSYRIPFHHLPVTPSTKESQEARILALVREHDVDLVVLARYMQVLSPALCAAMSGRIINIHHSTLPSFKGAKPYHQAYDRGVKVIGATAHFVTADLDEGPIIEQRVARVDHGMSPKQLTQEGSNVESQVLSAAVKWVAERRVFLNGHKTVVFS